MPPTRSPDAQAVAILTLLPAFQRWAATRAQAAGAANDLSLRQFVALHSIRERDGATSAADLARAWKVTPAVLTGIIDRLERRELVRRQPDPGDRRRQRLHLTAAGLVACREIEQVLTGELAAALAAARPDDRAGLDRSLALLAQALEALGGEDVALAPHAETDEAPPAEDRETPPARAVSHAPPNTDDATPAQPMSRPPARQPERHGLRETIMSTDVTAAADLDVVEAAASHEALGAPNGAPAGGAVHELEFASSRAMAGAHARYAELREQGPVTRVRFSFGPPPKDEDPNVRRQRESYFVADYDSVVATLLDDRIVVNPTSLMTPEQRAQAPATPEEYRPLTRSLLGIDPPDHTRIRKLVQPSFTGRGMEALRPRIQAAVDELLDEAERTAAARGEQAPNRRMELVEALAYPFPVKVISDLLGMPQADRDRLRGWTENLLRFDSERGRPEVEEEIRAGLREFIAYLRELFARKRAAPADDMISRLVHAEDEGDALTEDETLATVFLMYLAGHVTTVNLVGNGIVALLQNPAELAKVRVEPGLIKNVVEETLRYWGPVDIVVRRFAGEPMTIADTAIARGEQITVSLAAANRDPAKFDQPDQYDVGRENANRHVAFGKGIHVCLGAPLARIEGQVAFETLLRRYPELRLAAPDDLEWASSFLRGFRQVPLLF